MAVESVVIIGSGPAGYTAAIYAARAGLNPVLILGEAPGGQLTVTTDVENYPGFAKAIQGPWLMEQMHEQAQHVGTQIIQGSVVSVDFAQSPFVLKLDDGREYSALSVIVSTGAQAKWLGLESETRLRGFGVSGCATCDGPFFKGADVAVVGGGNAAVEEALYLARMANTVTLIHRRDKLRAEKIAQARLLSHPKIKMLWNSEVHEVLGDEDAGVHAVAIRNVLTGAVENLNVTGLFIAIGHAPNTNLFRGQLDLDQDGYIVTVPGTTRTSVRGVFAAGDVQDKIYRQAVTAAGTGCMAALEVEKYLVSI